MPRKKTSQEAAQPGPEPSPPKPRRQRPAPAGRGPQDVLRDIHQVADSALSAGDLRTALRALELEGRHLGLFGPSADDAAQAASEITLYHLPDNRRG